MQGDGVASCAPGTTFAGHRIDALAGRGGMGVVYRATDLALDRQVALKLIAPGAAPRTPSSARASSASAGWRRRSTTRTPSRSSTPARRTGVLYVTMRYVEGTDLGAAPRAESPLEPERAVGLVAQVAGALDEAHRHGLVHRDVKPANVLVARANGARARVPDRLRALARRSRPPRRT